MRRTYITRMPDKAGAFLLASNIISAAGGNIARVNYNKAIETHTLFIEVSAHAEQLEEIARRLSDCGYLSDSPDDKELLMIVLKLPDSPGAVTPVLEILNHYKVNISYISSQENGTEYQYFKMGLLIENTGELKRLVEDISTICEISILDYNVTDRLLDGTVFYVTFANQIRKILNLNQETTNQVLIQANKLMQLLDEQNKAPLMTFDYIRRFAKLITDNKDENFNARIQYVKLADSLFLHAIEPPCGSSIYILEYENQLLFIDCGFACYKNEMLSLLKKLFNNFLSKSLEAFITHADIDHTGLLSLFDKVYMNQNCYDNFKNHLEGRPDFREQNPLHAPYCALSKIISEYKPPQIDRCVIIGSKQDDSLLSYINSLFWGKWKFDFYEGCGGHINGETIIICEELNLLFSGDIYVNIKSFSDEQREFNQLAPFLMTGVDLHPEKARKCREYLLSKYKGFLCCPGHGPMQKI